MDTEEERTPLFFKEEVVLLNVYALSMIKKKIT